MRSLLKVSARRAIEGSCVLSVKWITSEMEHSSARSALPDGRISSSCSSSSWLPWLSWLSSSSESVHSLLESPSALRDSPSLPSPPTSRSSPTTSTSSSSPPPSISSGLDPSTTSSRSLSQLLKSATEYSLSTASSTLPGRLSYKQHPAPHHEGPSSHQLPHSVSSHLQ